MVRPAISVVIPAYNAADWLPRSVPRVIKSLEVANIKNAEIIIVNDGSTDNTSLVAKKISSRFPIRVIDKENSGRFSARRTGAISAKYDQILFIDTRIFIESNAIKFIVDQISLNPTRRVWTSHVHLDKKGNIYARFWDAITKIAWRRYFSKPRDYSYGINEFDFFPKGTTCFFVPRKLVLEANEWFVNNTIDLKASNDDTLLIRKIVESENININPKFSCIYHARTNLTQYTKHVFHRGQVFVDGFLRRDGNIYFYPLIFFLIISAIVPVALLVWASYYVYLLIALLSLWFAVLIIALSIRINLKDAISLFILMPLFVCLYGAGIWKAFIRSKVIPFLS